MSSKNILQKLEKLYLVHSFIDMIEIKFLSDELVLQKIEVAKKSIDNALFHLVYDLQKKIYDQQNNVSGWQKVDLVKELEIACESLRDIGDQSLNKNLEDLIAFGREYKSGYSGDVLKSDSEFLSKLKNKILIIISERIG